MTIFPRKIQPNVCSSLELAGRIVQENLSDVHGQTAVDFNSGAHSLSVENVFQLVDQRSPSGPPSYEEAIRHQALELATYGSQTVGSMRARMLSLEARLRPPLPVHHRGDSRNTCGQEALDGPRLWPRTESWKQSRTVCASIDMAGQVTVTRRPELHRPRTVSESQQKNKQALLARRCSQPVFDADQFRFAKESYI